MEKQSQKRSLKDIIREKNPLNSATEFFNQRVKTLMSSMREVDKEIRAIVIGDKSNDSLKEIIKKSRSLFNRKEYINSFIVLDGFRENLGKVSQKCEQLKIDINLNYKEYFLNELTNNEKESLIEFRNKLDQEIKSKNIKAAQIYSGFVKDAGVIDFFRSIFTQRGRALRAWEKAHGKEVEAMKNELVILLNNANSTLDEVNESLKTMSYALSIRDISAFSKELKVLSKTYKLFNDKYKKFYSNHIKDLIATLQKDDSVIDDPANGGRDTIIMSKEEQEALAKRQTIYGEPVPDALNLAPQNDVEKPKENAGVASKPKENKKSKTKKATVDAARIRLEKLAKSV